MIIIFFSIIPTTKYNGISLEAKKYYFDVV